MRMNLCSHCGCGDEDGRYFRCGCKTRGWRNGMILIISCYLLIPSSGSKAIQIRSMLCDHACGMTVPLIL